MKKFSLFAACAALVINVSCDKPQTEAERNAQVEREVQQRLAEQRTADDQQRIAQQQAELDAREQALAGREAGTATESVTPGKHPVSAAAAANRNTPRPRAASGERATESYDTFYRKLEPYGAWRETADYGYVWQPQQAQRSRDWRPYTDGRWAYTDSGWTWMSEEPYGWATYHYGRWTRLRGVGWVWVPGDEWAPAWVSWRKSDEYVGWAPLPPEAHFDRRRGIQQWADSYYDIDADEYVFIPNEAIGSQRLERDVVPVERNVAIVNQTTNITNITYNNTMIVNEGPNYDELRTRSREPVERFRLERRFDAETNATQPVVRGDVLAVTAPVFAAQASERPRTTGEPIRQVTVERSWANNVNPAEAERARQKMKGDATPPPDAPPKRYEKPTMVASTPAATATAAAETTASPAISPHATATVTATATATSTATPVASAATSPTASPRATATVTATTTPSASPSVSISPRPRVTPMTTPRAIASPSVSPTTTASPSSSPRASASAVASPSATATTSPVFTPRVRPTLSPATTPPESALPTPSATFTPRPIRAPSPMTTPLPTVTATPARAASPSVGGSPNSALDADDRATDATGTPPANGSARGPRGPRAFAPPGREPATMQPVRPDAAESAARGVRTGASPAAESTPAATPVMTPRVHTTPPPAPAFTPATPRPAPSLAPTVAPVATSTPPPRMTPAPRTTPIPTATATATASSAAAAETPAVVRPAAPVPVNPRMRARPTPSDTDASPTATPTGQPEQ